MSTEGPSARYLNNSKKKFNLGGIDYNVSKVTNLYMFKPFS